MKFLKHFESQLVLQFERTQKYLKGKDISLLMSLKIIKKSQSIPVWQWVISCLINVDFPLSNSVEKIFSLTISHEKIHLRLFLPITYIIGLNGSISLRVLRCILCCGTEAQVPIWWRTDWDLHLRKTLIVFFMLNDLPLRGRLHKEKKD